MNRFLTLASGGLFVTGLAILPISAFAQPSGNDAKADIKPVAPTAQPMSNPAMQPMGNAATKPLGSTAVKIPAPVAKADPAVKQAVVAKDVPAHHLHHGAASAAGAPKAAAPVANATSGVQPKAVDHSKS